MEIPKGKKLQSFRIDADVIEKFDGYLSDLKSKTGDYIAKEGVIEFFMDYCTELKPKDFLQLYYAYRTKRLMKD